MNAERRSGGLPGNWLCAAALAWVCFCGGAYAGDGASESGSLDRLVGDIRQSHDIRKAAVLYAKGRAIDPRNVELYRAYMCTALKCGFPRIACYAAAELTQLEPRDGAAWSVLAYQNAMRQDYRQAISAGVQAADLLGDNASVLNNVGYLLGWYEGSLVPPRLNDKVTRSMAGQKPKWLKSPLFSKCYNETLAAAKAYNDRLAQCKDKAQEAKRRLDMLTGLAKKLQAAAASNASVIDACDSKIDSLQMLLDRTLNDPIATDAAKNSQARAIESQMNILRDRRNRWNGYLTQATQRMQSLAGEIQAAAAASADADKRLKDAEVPTFKPVWQPPDVDGLVTADAEPDGPTSISASPVTAAAAPAQGPSTIDSLVEMAKLLIRNGQEEKGRQSLKAIISKHPSSEGAKEAQAVLDNPVAAYHDRPGRPVKPADAPPAAEHAQIKDVAPAPKTAASTGQTVNAEELLQAARLLVRNDQSAAAESLLQTIMHNHAGTPAAKEAKVLLAGLK
ncbi:MAG: hypothetical protein LLG01_01000 [Planctomycetaceae bacterium]|nr:hypothetical protein [Planctomycetaceae bacterium]